MKALTIWPEWIWAILHLGKRVENRSWEPPQAVVGQRIALHAGAHVGGRPGRAATDNGLRSVGGMAVRAGWSWMLGEELDYVSFCPVCGSLGDPVDMWLREEDDRELSASCRRLVRGAFVGTAILARATTGDQTPWAVPGMVHWHLEDLKVLPEAIPAIGKQRLWNVPEEIEEAMR